MKVGKLNHYMMSDELSCSRGFTKTRANRQISTTQVDAEELRVIRGVERRNARPFEALAHDCELTARGLLIVCAVLEHNCYDVHHFQFRPTSTAYRVSCWVDRDPEVRHVVENGVPELVGHDG